MANKQQFYNSNYRRATCIYCTLVMNGDAYLPGALVLAKSLRASGTKNAIWCLITPDVSFESRQLLWNYFDCLVEVAPICLRCKPLKTKRQQVLYGKWIEMSFTKWHILNPSIFPEKSKVILLDADMVVMDNIDHIFSLRSPALTFSSPWTRPYCTNYAGMPNPYGMLRHGDQVSHSSICNGLSSSFVGLACMVLVEPSARLWQQFQRLLSLAATRPYSSWPNCYSGYDEQIFAELILSLGLPVHNIYQKYNWIVGKYSWLMPGEKASVWHYYGSEKPWQQDRNAYPDLKNWWKFADELLEDENENNMNKWFSKLALGS